MNEIISLEKARYPHLEDRRVVIVGGTGGVGEGIVRAWLKTGAHVIVPSRTEGKVSRFQEAVSDLGRPERLAFTIGAYGGFDDAQAMAHHVTADHGPVTDVVASIGGWWQGKPLWDISTDDWRRYFVEMATSHVATARAWLPRLPPAGSYQLILGGSAIEPVPGASIVSMQQAALLMMRRVLSAETANAPRVVAQVLGPVITRMRHRYDPDWVSSEEVGLASAGIAASAGASGEDFVAFNKTQMLATLQKLGVYP